MEVGGAGRSPEEARLAAAMGEIPTIASEIHKLKDRALAEARERGRVSSLVLALLSTTTDELRRECDRLRDANQAADMQGRA